MPPKNSKKKKVTPWDIALNHVGEAEIAAAAHLAGHAAGHKAGHLAGRIHEHAEEYESPGWDIDLTELEPDEKGITRVKVCQHGLPVHVKHAPQNTTQHLYGGFNGTLRKVKYSSDRYESKVKDYEFDFEDALSHAKTLMVGDSGEWVIGAKGKESRISEAYSMKVTHLGKKK